MDDLALACVINTTEMQNKANIKLSSVQLPQVPFSRQSMPSRGLFSFTCLDLTSARVLMGASPLFSARARGIDSRASENARIAYCSKLEV